jgi:hypothetical protein
MADDTPYASIVIQGVDLKSEVQSIDVEDHDRAIDRARVVFDSSDNVAQILREQSKVLINLGWTQQNALIFEGIVKGVKVDATGTGQSRVTLTAYDLSYKMMQNRTKDRLFTSGKLSDALQAIVQDYFDIIVGKISIDPDPDLTHSPWQKPSGKSDWDFIQEKAVECNARAFVEVNDQLSQFYFVSEQSLLKGDPMGVLHYCPGGVGPLLEFKYERTASAASPVAKATVVDPETGNPVTQQADAPPPDPPFAVGPGASDDVTQAATVMASASGQPTDARPKTVIAGQPPDPARAQQSIKQDPTRVLGFSGQGTARGTIMLRAKGKVTISGLPPWAEGDWYVHKVNHIYTRIAVNDRQAHTADRSTYQTKFSVTR